MPKKTSSKKKSPGASKASEVRSLNREAREVEENEEEGKEEFERENP